MFSASQVTLPPAGRPHDLRHAAVSTWLNGVEATRVAEWAGHSVHVLLRVYAKCTRQPHAHRATPPLIEHRNDAVVVLRPSDPYLHHFEGPLMNSASEL